MLETVLVLRLSIRRKLLTVRTARIMDLTDTIVTTTSPCPFANKQILLTRDALCHYLATKASSIRKACRYGLMQVIDASDRPKTQKNQMHPSLDHVKDVNQELVSCYCSFFSKMPSRTIVVMLTSGLAARHD